MKLEKGSTMQSNSNLECFLNSTSPIVQSQFLPKSEIRSLNRLWHPREREEVEFFRLRDLWAFYDELSAYGAGVPIAMDSGETLVQYFVPYLSALQIFTSNSSVHTFRRDEGDSGESEIVVRSRDSCSSDTLSDDSEVDKSWEGSSEGGFDQEINNNEDPINNNNNNNDNNNSDLHVNDRLGFLYFQYFEKSAPYGRVPLMDKINSLAQRYPGLMSLRSVDLSPASWMAVAWYPIYHIPMGRTIKDLSTCFLTYHTLSSSFQDMDIEEDIESMSERKKKRKEGDGISLPAFGLASYKMQGNVWISGNLGRDQERLFSLLSVADSWLKQLRVQHHDFIYFTSIRR